MSRRPRGRVLHRVAIAFGFGLLLAVVPLPALTFTTQSVGAVEGLPTPTTMPPDQLAAAQAAVDEPIGDDRVVAGDRSTGTFTAIGFTFDEQPSGPVLVRIRDADGNLGEWQELESEAGDGPDAGTGEADRPSTTPVWVRDATGYEVSIPRADVSGAAVVTVHDELHRATSVATPVAGAATAPPFGIGLRSAWGARPPSSGPSFASTVKLAVVHHSAGSNAYSQAEVPSVLRSIQAFHMDGNGWSDIGYNFVVDKYGGVWEGRGGGIDRAVIGAHANGFNTTSVGVMVIGDYTQATPTAGALERVSQVIGWKMAQYGNDPSAPVAFTSACSGTCKYPAGQTVQLPGTVGHQDVGLTSCPGSIESSLGAIRQRASAWAALVRASSTPVGSLDSLTAGNGTVTATGWAKDPSTSNPVGILLTAGDVTVGTNANRSRPDVQAVYPGYGPSTGFVATANGVAPGVQLACVTALDADGPFTVNMGCARVLVGDPTGLSPTGNFSAAAGGTGVLQVTGWTADADGPAPRLVTVTVDGAARWQAGTASDGTFTARIAGVVAGRREVCFDVRNGGAGVDVTARCIAIDVGGASPAGNVDGFTRQGNYVSISGWADDVESAGPIAVDVLLDRQRAFRAVGGRPRPDVAAARGTGADSGFVQELYGVPAGSHELCAVARNVGAGTDQWIGCRSVVVK